MRVVHVDGVSARQGRVRAEDERVGLAAHGFRAEVRAVGGKTGIGERGEGDFGDRRIAIARREGVDDTPLPEIAPLTIPVESGVTEVGVKFSEDLGDEDRFVGSLPVPLSVIAMAVGLRPTCTDPSRTGLSGSRDDDGYGAFRVVRHIEKGAVRGQGAATRLRAHLDLALLPCPDEVNDRDGAADAVSDIGRLSFGWTATQRGS